MGPRGLWWPQVATTTAPGDSSRTPSTATNGPGRLTRRGLRGSIWQPACSPRAWTDEAEGEAAGALEAFLALGAKDEAGRARSFLAATAGDCGEPASAPAVTPREREVLSLLAEGLTNRQIAERLVVSEHTVHRHVTNILRKLDLPSRTAAAAYAIRAGLIDPT